MAHTAFTKGNIGKSVLILGGTGGVGCIAIQLAKAMGSSVTTTCSTKNIEYVKSLGAYSVFDYTKESPSGQYILVLDCVRGIPDMNLSNRPDHSSQP